MVADTPGGTDRSTCNCVSGRQAASRGLSGGVGCASTRRVGRASLADLERSSPLVVVPHRLGGYALPASAAWLFLRNASNGDRVARTVHIALVARYRPLRRGVCSPAHR